MRLRRSGYLRFGGKKRLVAGIIFDISRYAIHDGPGIRTTVFFKGCPLNCWWCHNPESMAGGPQLAMREARCIRCGRCIDGCPNGASAFDEGVPVTDASLCRLCLECTRLCHAEAREVVGRTMTVDEVMTEIEKDTPFFDESGGGVTFSGGEPLMQPVFLIRLLEECGRLEIHRTVDTSGHASRDILLKAAEQSDLFLYDLKHMDPGVHRQYTGVSNQTILDNLRALSERPVQVRVRFPVIPGINDSLEHAAQMGFFLRQLPRVKQVDLLPYHDVMRTKYRRLGVTWRLGPMPPPDSNHLREIAETLCGFGLHVTIGGEQYERAYATAQTIQS
jgi:pyruvate formate lyase activating enzyme